MHETQNQSAISVPEILAPAGDAVALRAALDAGADAVYMGAGGLNMRSRARNFQLEDLPEAVNACHAAGARCYLTLNTVMYEDEYSTLSQILDAATHAGVDAIIAWDWAVVAAARERGLEVHLSTQASVSNFSALMAVHQAFGVQRVVLARECTLEHIHSIQKSLTQVGNPVELEVFVHGAMCVAVSGRCFLSQYSCGQSANRGACLQPCRRNYIVKEVDGEGEFLLGESHVMSPKDLCTMPFLERVLATGIRSLKIEGRMRSPEYVSTVVSAYRQAVDAWASLVSEGKDPGQDEDFHRLKSESVERLQTVFNRGFSSGFYMGRPIDDWIKGPNNQATLSKESVGTVVNYYRKAQVAMIALQATDLKVGDDLLIQGPTTGNQSLRVDELRVNEQSCEQAQQGSEVSVAVPFRVRRGDLVFRRIPNKGLETP
ncbi:MAG: U32 family peptidase [Spirochaetales bacterium]|nr:U32 family peptidase [Spirochaetales bacterium]